MLTNYSYIACLAIGRDETTTTLRCHMHEKFNVKTKRNSVTVTNKWIDEVVQDGLALEYVLLLL